MNHPPPIGKNIQTKRKEKRMSLEALAKRSGVSKSMISQIEQDKTNPTIVTVWKLARALNMSVNELMELKNGALIEVIRKGEIPTTPTNDGLGELTVNSPLDSPDCIEIYTLALEPGGVNESESHGPNAEEYLILLSGEILLKAGEHEEILIKGDSAKYNADITHVATNIGKDAAVMILVVNVPNK